MVYPRNDLVFKRIFGDKRSGNILKSFLKSILNLDENDLSKIEIVESSTRINKAENKEEIDKNMVLDIKCTTETGKIIGIEIQIANDPNMRDRIIFNSSRTIADQLFRGEEYSELKKVITIVISVEHIIIKENNNYRFCFSYYDAKNNVELSKLSEIHILEAKKMPKEDKNNSDLIDWLKFIRSKSEEEMNMLANKNTAINEAVCVYKELTADEAFREQAWKRQLFIWDRNSQINGAKREGIAIGRVEGIAIGEAKLAKEKAESEAKLAREKRDIALKLIEKGLELNFISETTNLSIEEIKALKSQI
jgi:predicted transposase/invertase (TIGR01784 family)